MGDFRLDTAAPRSQTVTINGAGFSAEFAVLGVTRRVQTEAARRIADANRIMDAAKDATGAELADLIDQAARVEIAVASLRLRPATEGGEPASELLTRLWEEDSLERDRHLTPLVKHLYGGGVDDDPPA